MYKIILFYVGIWRIFTIYSLFDNPKIDYILTGYALGGGSVVLSIAGIVSLRIMQYEITLIFLQYRSCKESIAKFREEKL